MKFKRISLSNWRQFQNIEIEFHPRMTIIAGANGAGKSTILKILAQHFGLTTSLLATPMMSKFGIMEYFSGIFDQFYGNQDKTHVIGEIKYENNSKSKLSIPVSASVQYNLKIINQTEVRGIFINSHRPVSIYQPVGNIPTNAINAERAYQAYSQEINSRYNNSFTQFTPTYRIKEAIISMATFGPGNKNVQKNKDLDETYDQFKIVLQAILPSSIGFKDISVRIPDVVIVTETGEFMIDAASGGLMSLIDIAWQIFLFSRGKSNFVVVMDEPENHLHPSMQRSVMDSLLCAFPDAQFIVATHSPFIVSSIRDSAVYVLRHGEGGAIEGPNKTVLSERLGGINKGGTASDILRQVLGVPVTMPIWAEQEVEVIASEFDIENLNSSSIRNLRSRLEQAGLLEYYADALLRVARRHD